MKKHARVVVFLILFATLIIEFPRQALAHERQFEHYQEIDSVLFGDSYLKNKNSIKDKITAINYASYLTVDQFKGDGKTQFNELKRQRMGGLPLSFSQIDYDYDLISGTKQITANTHREYTHQGWDRVYTNSKVQTFWTARRKILLGTLNSIFDFQPLNYFGLFTYDEKCNALAGIIYYVHILGDYDEADKYTKISKLTDLSGRGNANEIDKDYDMITSLKNYIEILFSDQKGNTDYQELIKGLEVIERPAAKLVNSTGGVNTEEEFEEYKGYSTEIMDLLKKYIPKLLKNEEFFRKVFYPELSKNAA